MKTARKLASVVLALVMILSLSICAFADEITVGTLTVTGDRLTGKTVSAIEMFEATEVKSTDGFIGSGDTVKYVLLPAWDDFFTDTMLTGAYGADKSEKAYNYVRSLSDESLYAFAEAAKNYAIANSLTATTVKAVDNTATLANLDAGYYLVYPQAGSTSVLRKTDAVLVNVPRDTAVNLNLKTVYPTVDKAVDADGDNDFSEAESASIGDTVSFQLTAAVPEMSDYNSYEFNFVDTMSAGLTYDNGSAKVTIGGEEVTPSRVTYVDNVLRVEFDDLKTVDGVQADEKIVVTYSATVNANAVVGSNKNTVHVEYSNDPTYNGDPGNGPTENSDDDDAEVYTFEINVDKYTGTYGEEATRLSGAVFALKAGDDVIKLVDLSTEDGEGNVTEAKYRVATEEDTDTVETFVTPANGKVKIEGLAAGTYYLSEVSAPAGYNKLAEAVTIVIGMTTDAEGEYTGVTYAINGKAATDNSTIPVENKTGAVLPETGAMGTIGLTIFGVLVVILGVALPHKKNGRA